MGCFSYLCKKSGKSALSTSFDGSPVYIFLLQNGKVIEEMYGNYDSYGKVFTADKKNSFEWEMNWDKAVDLHFSSSEGNGFAVILEEYYDGIKPTTKSQDCPNQGWGEEEDFIGNTDEDSFKKVEKPYHKSYNKIKIEIKKPDPIITEEDLTYLFHLESNPEKLKEMKRRIDKLIED